MAHGFGRRLARFPGTVNDNVPSRGMAHKTLILRSIFHSSDGSEETGARDRVAASGRTPPGQEKITNDSVAYSSGSSDVDRVARSSGITESAAEGMFCFIRMPGRRHGQSSSPEITSVGTLMLLHVVDQRIERGPFLLHALLRGGLIRSPNVRQACFLNSAWPRGSL